MQPSRSSVSHARRSTPWRLEARYFTTNEARLAGFDGDLEVVLGKNAMRAVLFVPGLWSVEVLCDGKWSALNGQWCLESSHLHKEEGNKP